jgi:hypothetical protein
MRLFVSTVLVVGVIAALNVTTISALAQNTASGNKTASNMTNATPAKTLFLGTIANKTMNAIIALPKSTITSPTLPTGHK